MAKGKAKTKAKAPTKKSNVEVPLEKEEKPVRRIKVGERKPNPASNKVEIRGVLGNYIYGKTKYEKGKRYKVPQAVAAYLLNLRDTAKDRPYFELANKPLVHKRKPVPSPEQIKNRGNRTLPNKDNVIVVEESPLEVARRESIKPNVDWEDEDFDEDSDEFEDSEENQEDEEVLVVGE